MAWIITPPIDEQFPAITLILTYIAPENFVNYNFAYAYAWA